MNVGNLLTGSALRFPEKVAVVEEEKRATYRQLNEAVNQLAHGLIDLGVKKGRKVAIFLSNCLEWMEIYFALSKIGGIIVPINYRLIGDDLNHIINHSDSEVVFLDETRSKVLEEIRHRLNRVKHFVFLGDNPPSWCISYRSLKEGHRVMEPEISVGGLDEHTISYTSGTTGLPKGAILTAMNVVIGNYTLATIEFGVTHEDVFLVTTPLGQRIGWGKIVNSVALGCKIVIMPSFNPLKAIELVENERVTIMSIIPTIGRMILQIPNLESYGLKSLRMFFVTGEIFPLETKKGLVEKFPHVKLVSYFGQTEAGMVSHIFPEDILQKYDSVGLPFIGIEMKVVNDQMEVVPAGTPGEVIVRCGQPGACGVMKGYYKDIAGTQETFWEDWIRTGDIGRLDENGYLYLVDRKKDMIISGGFNIYSKEVERVLESHPKVLEAAVVGVPDKDYGEAVKAFVVLHSGQQATQEEIIEFCKSKMASYKKPKEVEFIESLPRSPMGKVLKYKLRGK